MTRLSQRLGRRSAKEGLRCVLSVVPLVALFLVSACNSRASREPFSESPAPTGDGFAPIPEPLGWTGPVAARKVRNLPAEVISEAPWWKLAEPPAMVVTLDSVLVPQEWRRSPGVRAWRHQRVAGGVVQRSGQVLFAVHDPGVEYPDGPSDSTLLHLLDPAENRHVRIPALQQEQARSLRWGNRFVVTRGDGVVLAGEPLDIGPPVRSLGFAEVLYLDGQGRPTSPPARVGTPMAQVVGSFPDGSMLFSGPWRLNSPEDTTVVNFFQVARPLPIQAPSTDSVVAEVLFSVRAPRAPNQRAPRRGVHTGLEAVGVFGDTTWVVATERPELVALNRKGEALVRVNWETGSRAIPPGVSRWQEVDRVPAASSLIVGAEGRVWVQLWSVEASGPVAGPEWLVFAPDGTVLARAEIPVGLQLVAVGGGFVLATALDDAGHQEVRVYAIHQGP